MFGIQQDIYLGEQGFLLPSGNGRVGFLNYETVVSKIISTASSYP